MFFERSNSLANAAVALRSSTAREILIAAALRFMLLIFSRNMMTLSVNCNLACNNYKGNKVFKLSSALVYFTTMPVVCQVSLSLSE